LGTTEEEAELALENLRIILEEAGSSMEKLLKVTTCWIWKSTVASMKFTRVISRAECLQGHAFKPASFPLAPAWRLMPLPTSDLTLTLQPKGLSAFFGSERG
jgi:hypothetical protein